VKSHPRHVCGRKRHAKTDKTDCRLLRMLLAEGRLPECWIPPGHILECRALLETYHDLRREHTAWVRRIHAVLFHQGAPALGDGALRSEQGLAALRAVSAAHLSPAGQLQVATARGKVDRTTRKAVIAIAILGAPLTPDDEP
jgi:transposase